MELFARLGIDDLTDATHAAIRKALPLAHARDGVIVRVSDDG